MIHIIIDQVVIRKFKSGDLSSFDSLFKKYNKKVYYLALSYLRNKEDAEDIVQEVFLNLWKCRTQIDENYVFSRYLSRIAFNAICKKFRSQATDRRCLEESLRYMDLADNSTSFNLEYNNLLEIVNRYIKNLPARQRIILLLSIEKLQSIEEIAKDMRISKKTVENYLSSARSSLKKSIHDSGVLSLLILSLL